MGGLIVVDDRLYDAVIARRLDPCNAAQWATLQAAVSDRYDHILALNDEYVWRRIVATQRDSVPPDLWIRCLICGTRAKARDWGRGVSVTMEQRERLERSEAVRAQPSLLDFMRNCTGREGSRISLEILTDWCDQDAGSEARGVTSEVG